MTRLAGKIALISGAAGGIGAATARAMAQERAKIVICNILDEPGQHVANQIAADGGQAIFVHLDVTREEDWEATVQLATSRFGGVDILFNTQQTTWARALRK